MKIRIIELLEMIANGEQPPKKILFKNDIYEYSVGDIIDYYCDSDGSWLFDDYDITDILTDEAEILETTITYNQDNIENNKQDKIEKLYAQYEPKIRRSLVPDNEALMFKINEIIDKLNGK